MNKKHSNYLYKHYPEIFAQKDLPMNQTCMCWGFDCEDGWFDLLNSLCEHITTACKNNKWEIPQATQVKEKYGGLRFYTSGVDPKASEMVEGAIWFAESLSYKICEVCGKFGAKPNNTGWIRTRCKECREKK